MVHALKVRVAPVRDWPEPQDRPEKTEPPHGEGSGESPLYGGMAVYSTTTINVNASGHSWWTQVRRVPSLTLPSLGCQTSFH